ncbi:hypothetical protein [Haloarchaeobius sp. HME9146]|uniref:hypothetical protein n=1 Tax=unclassified Haloarchaeobius TaxID=2614452 RepID=UPI0021C146AB|nr:hypothetical protein [Haloarchaeobius sp. HME9146]MCT9096869.1 hypothetical protein [Haloarchaeobius sp. HME9146]
MNSTNSDSEPSPPDINNRYRARDTGDGHVEIYDSKKEDAWIRSDYTLDLARPN